MIRRHKRTKSEVGLARLTNATAPPENGVLDKVEKVTFNPWRDVSVVLSGHTG